MSSLRIDWTRCDGHGLCARLLPEAISLDEWGFPVIGRLDDASSADVRTAVASCPRLALRVEK
ncbi:MAG: ferredoxin [Nocardioidaceae bacterium]|nr:ferredoxin [Nocardioidaceae bacterium]MCL2614455.1 ferredoxin [Nocardioidaceae bacterium]